MIFKGDKMTKGGIINKKDYLEHDGKDTFLFFTLNEDENFIYFEPPVGGFEGMDPLILGQMLKVIDENRIRLIVELTKDDNEKEITVGDFVINTIYDLFESCLGENTVKIEW